MSNFDLIDFFRASAEFMVKENPDWTYERAFNTLVTWHNDLSQMDVSDVNGDLSCSTGGFVLTRRPLDEGADAYELSLMLASAYIFPVEQEIDVRSWTKDSGVLKHGVDLPDVSEDLD